MSALIKIEPLERRRLLADTGTGSHQVNDSDIFAQTDAEHGTELWRRNHLGGSNPALLMDINPGPDGSFPRWSGLSRLGGWIYFSAYTASGGRELYRSDGTSAERIADIVPGPEGSDPKDFVAFNGKVYFNASTPAGGRELYWTDGKSTAMVADIAPGANGSDPAEFISLNDKLYFSAYTPAYGRELYRTDGRLTERVAEIAPGPDGSDPAGFILLNNKLYFSAYSPDGGRELYRTNGMLTERVADIAPGSDGSYPHDLTAGNGKLYFAATTPATGEEVFVWDGTSVELLRDINPGSGSSRPRSFAVYGDGLITFYAHGTAYRSDGTTDGTVPTGPAPVQVGNKLYFTDWDSEHGSELWKTNLDYSNPQLVKDIRPGPDGSTPESLYNFNGTLFFSASGKLTRSDGTAEGTVPIFEFDSGNKASDFTELNGRLLFLLKYTEDLYVTDGTTGGTALLYADSPPYSRTSVVELLGVRSGLLYFTVNSSDHRQFERWQTDGTLAGTRHIPPGARIIDGSLDVEGTTGNDDIQITADATTTTVVFNGAAIQFANSAFESIWVDGQSGNDRIFLTSDVKHNAILLGGAGNDSLTGGGGNDNLIGGTGNDTADYTSQTMPLTTAGGSGVQPAIVSSDRGSDTIRLETLLCGSGDDQIYYHSTVIDGLQYIDGGAGNDSLTMTRTEAGGPTILGGAGNDSIGGSSYNRSAVLGGDDGDDFISVDPRARTTYSVGGGDGYDIVVLGLRWPNEKLSSYLSRYPGVEGIIADSSGTITPTIQPSPPPPPPPLPEPEPSPTATPPVVNNPSLTNHVLRINGTSSSDRITVRRSNTDAGVLQVVLNGKIRSFTFSDVTKVIIDGKEGDDFINLKSIAITSTVLGGKGNDTILGSDAADSITGGAGDDSIYGYAGNDNLGGNDGNDYICGGTGIDFIRGGGGIDTIVGRFKVDDLKDNKGDSLVNDLLG